MLSRPVFSVKYAAVLALAPLPLLTLLPGSFAGHIDYAFAPFAIVGAVVLGRMRLRRTPSVWPGSPWIGRGLLAAAGMTLFAAAVLGSPWGAAMSLVLTAAVLAWEFGGRPAVRAVMPALFLVALCVPLPLDLDRWAVGFMARSAARWAGHFLDLIGVAHVQSDQVLAYTGGRLDLSDQLGGPVSPFAVAALVLGLAQALGRGFWRTVILMTTGLAFLPVVTAAAAAAQVAWAGGVPNLVWAAGCAAVATGLAFSFDQWLGIRASLALLPHPAWGDVVPTAPAGPVAVGGAIGRFSAAVFAGLAALQVCAFAAPTSAPPAVPENWLPERIGPWVADREHRSNFAAAATYRNGDRQLMLIVSPAAATGGPPVADLEVEGWVVRVRAAPQRTDDPTVVAQLEMPADRFATVWACGLAADGGRVAPPTPLFGTAARARRALTRPFGGDSRGAGWWVRGVMIAAWPPTARDMIAPSAVVRSACESLGRRIRGEDGP